ncbi:MAG: Jag N-terminal domain-containing protein [Elusimicrobia bacterium]|nr:Jag N-terminal domain-containing protein [Elusimicrobiota bacterium]
MKEIEIEGKTVTHAVEQGLSDLGLRRDQVEVEVVEEGSPGFLGLGSKLAKVRIREKVWDDAAPPSEKGTMPGTPRTSKRQPADAPRREASSRPPASAPRGGHRYAPPRERPESAPSPRAQRPGTPRATQPAAPSLPSPVHQAPPDIEKACAETKVVMDELLQLLRIEHPDVIVSWDDKQVRVRAEIETPDTQVLLGKGGQSLESLQFLVTLMLSRRMRVPVAVQVDCANYWHEREEAVLLQMHQAMEMVKRTQRSVRLKPMDSCMRRLVHRTLVNHPEFETISEGEGPWRKVVIKPKKK